MSLKRLRIILETCWPPGLLVVIALLAVCRLSAQTVTVEADVSDLVQPIVDQNAEQDQRLDDVEAMVRGQADELAQLRAYVETLTGVVPPDSDIPLPEPPTPDASEILLKVGDDPREAMLKAERDPAIRTILVMPGVHRGVFGEWTRSDLTVRVVGNQKATFLTDGRVPIWNIASYEVSRCTIKGIEFIANTRKVGHPDFKGWTAQKGVSWLARGQDITFEDCTFDSFSFGVVVYNVRGFTLRRVNVLDSWTDPNGGEPGKQLHSQGIYADNVDGLLIESCLFDGNGWNPDAAKYGSKRTKFNHNLYIQSNCNNVVVIDNVLARASSHNCQLRSGGVFEGNDLYRGGFGMYSPNGSVRNNRVWGTENLDRGTSPNGIMIQAPRRGHPDDRVIVEGNFVAENVGPNTWDGGIHVGWTRSRGDGRGEARNNVVVKWRDTGITKRENLLVDVGNVVLSDYTDEYPSPQQDIEAKIAAFRTRGVFE
ncbi:MAG: right-handed parallel beta-helix repeat-containing protein [Planctomycetota bacterium]